VYFPKSFLPCKAKLNEINEIEKLYYLIEKLYYLIDKLYYLINEIEKLYYLVKKLWGVYFPKLMKLMI
jgi:hypothetical protein